MAEVLQEQEAPPASPQAEHKRGRERPQAHCTGTILTRPQLLRASDRIYMELQPPTSVRKSHHRPAQLEAGRECFPLNTAEPRVLSVRDRVRGSRAAQRARANGRLTLAGIRLVLCVGRWLQVSTGEM